MDNTKRRLRAEAVERLQSALQDMRDTMFSCRRTELQGWDTYWITANSFDKMLRELQDCADLLTDGEPTETEPPEGDVVHQLRSGAKVLTNVDFAKLLEAAANKCADVTLFGVDYVPLPLDADGVPIHVGDVMEWPDGSTFEVVGIGDGVLFYTEDDECADWTGASTKRHHREQTVEDVLREFALACEDAGNSGPEVARLAAEFAAKLRLAGDAE